MDFWQNHNSFIKLSKKFEKCLRKEEPRQQKQKIKIEKKSFAKQATMM